MSHRPPPTLLDDCEVCLDGNSSHAKPWYLEKRVVPSIGHVLHAVTPVFFLGPIWRWIFILKGSKSLLSWRFLFTYCAKNSRENLKKRYVSYAGTLKTFYHQTKKIFLTIIFSIIKYNKTILLTSKLNHNLCIHIPI